MLNKCSHGASQPLGKMTPGYFALCDIISINLLHHSNLGKTFAALGLILVLDLKKNAKALSY